jgi:hypothetical protein
MILESPRLGDCNKLDSDSTFIAEKWEGIRCVWEKSMHVRGEARQQVQEAKPTL